MTESIPFEDSGYPAQDPEREASSTQIKELVTLMDNLTDGIVFTWETIPEDNSEEGITVEATEEGNRFVCFPALGDSMVSFRQSTNSGGTMTIIKLEYPAYNDGHYRVTRVESLETDESPDGEVRADYFRFPELYVQGIAIRNEKQIEELRTQAGNNPTLKAVLREFDKLYNIDTTAVLTEARFENLSYILGRLKPEEAQILDGEKYDFDAILRDEF